MGLLDDVSKAMGAGGTQAAGGQGALMQALVGMLAGGGLQQLVSGFQQKGLGNVIGSWISTGANLPVSADQIQNALGPDMLSRLSGASGLDTGAIASQLSGLLPNLVDKLTPDGKLPEGVGLEKGLGILKGLF